MHTGRKPTIAVIDTCDPLYRVYEDDYQLVFCEPDYHSTPSEQVARMLTSLHDTPVDGVVGFQDLSSILAALLAHERQLIGPDPYAVYLAQNKAQFALRMQQASLPYPEMWLLDINTVDPAALPYPLFMKPIKGRLSSFSFLLHTQQECEEKIQWLKQQDRQKDMVFEHFFQSINGSYLPLRNWYHAQRFIDADQYTVDGFVFNSHVHLLGVTQSIYTPDRTSFERFDLPGNFPAHLFDSLHALIEQIVQQLAYNNSGFNVEFFLTAEEEILLIEFNTRISQGFGSLFQQRYRCSTRQMMFDLCLGRMPDLTVREHPKQICSFPLRVNHDCVIKQVPTKAEIEQICRDYDIAQITVLVEAGKKLSDYWQDAYTFRYALINIAGDSLDEILHKYTLVSDHVGIELERTDCILANIS